MIAKEPQQLESVICHSYKNALFLEGKKICKHFLVEGMHTATINRTWNKETLISKHNLVMLLSYLGRVVVSGEELGQRITKNPHNSRRLTAARLGLSKRGARYINANKFGFKINKAKFVKKFKLGHKVMPKLGA